MFGSLDTSVSALLAQRTRLNTISANLANQNSITNARGEYEPYRRRVPVFAPGDPSTGNQRGVHVREIMLDDAPLQQKFMPDHPFADEDGYVGFPNINSTVEKINALEAIRSYEANINAAEATKTMMQQAMRLIA